VNDQQMIGVPGIKAAFEVVATLKIGAENINISKPLRYRFTDPVKGEVYQPFGVVPPFTVITPEERIALRITHDWHERFTYRANTNLSSIAVYRGPYKILEAKNIARGRGGEHDALFDIALKDGGEPVDTFSFVYLTAPDGPPALTSREISYDHIPLIRYFHPATLEFSAIDLKTAGKNIGYITGAGDKVPESLTQMGYQVTLLGKDDLVRNDLSRFDAIITGVRAYNTNEWLNDYHEKLMKYVSEGGNLIVQYNTSNNIGPVRSKMGPYSFNITRTRVTDENSPVTFAISDHPVFNYPNRITKSDFDSWIQERSIYHGQSSDTAFRFPLVMNDPNEKGENGSLLIAKYGKGYFTYTGLAFFRQLPAGVAGAYRLLANLIALNRKKEF
jgi:hypothetical protein